MATETKATGPWQLADQIEAHLRSIGREDAIPEGGLGHWVAQAWPTTDDDLDPESWAADWLETIRRSDAD